jgi:hypothetical protein
VLLRLPYLALTSVFTLVRILPMSDVDKSVEILTLRHQLTVNVRSTSPASPRPTGRSSPPCSTGYHGRRCGSYT